MAQVTIGSQTLGSLKAMMTRFHKETEDADLLTDAANDAIEALWRNILLVSLGQFLGGPVTTLNIGSGSERATIISIPDPLVAPQLTTTMVGALASRTIDAAYTFSTESGSETNLSPIATVTTPPLSRLNVLPPAYVAAGGPIGWNIYACLHDGRMAKQNDEPLDFSQTYTEPADTGIQDSPDFPSAPVVNNTADNIFYIRLLQVQNPDSTWTTWKAGDLDGLLMQRASASVAAESTYQSYAYDVINGNQVEIRPATGQALNPRYFFVIKPRRLLYDRAVLPFSNISATEFLKVYGESQLDLSNKEFVSYNIKAKKAAGILQEIVQGLNTQVTVKQKAIVPYFRW